ncbi:unknown protein [Seminavis robusta]|uniref:Uncharacterized protein n=1 Tax=Seminavis robusta TaxID=568900 RepID=A0A9N8ENW4_9STRA|nr:unknown protein [Seminavis robusta]|eukprot:Sro1306_g261270.1 n/a (1212) ;mRNA; f:25528-30229
MYFAFFAVLVLSNLVVAVAGGFDQFAVAAKEDPTTTFSLAPTALNDVQELNALLQPSQANVIALQNSETALDAVERFGAAVDSLGGIIDSLEAEGALHPDVVPIFKHIKTELQVASLQSTEIVLELSDSMQNMQLSGGRHLDSSSEDNDDNDELDSEDDNEFKEYSSNEEQSHHQWTGWQKKANTHHETIRDHPKLRRHFDMHDAIFSGNIDFIYEMADDMESYHTSERTHRRLEDEPDYRYQQCKKLIGCIEEFSLYDIVNYYYGPYIDKDKGTLPNQTEMFLADANGTDNIHAHVQRITSYMKEAKENDYMDSTCVSLLQQFHTNEKKENYTIYVGPTVTKVCRARGSTKFVKIDEVRTKIGEGIANRLFDDLVRCASTIEDSKGDVDNTFFDEYNFPQLPISIHQDKHGAATESFWTGNSLENDVRHHYSFKKANPMKVARSKDGKFMPFQDILDIDEDCVARVNAIYVDIYKKQKTALFTDGYNETVDYPPIQVLADGAMKKVYIGIGTETSTAEQVCEIGAWFAHCPTDKTKIVGDDDDFWDVCKTGWTSFGVDGLFLGNDPGELDLAMRMTIGDSMSVGMVCAFAEATKKRPKYTVPGWCCMDTPSVATSWGDDYSCDQGVDRCNNKAPLLAGLSQSACDPWSGKWCSYPRDCSSLIRCVQSEIDWAKQNNKNGYKKYLTTAPQVAKRDSLSECGSVREYFGFHKNYPNDHEICDDLKDLRTNHHFAHTDKSSSNKEGNKKTSYATVTLAKQAELSEPDKPDTTDAEFSKLDSQVSALTVTITGLQQVSDIAGFLECPADFTGAVQTVCAAVKNVASVIAVVASSVMQVIANTVDDSIPSLSNYQQYEIYQNMDVVYDNMKILNKGIADLKTGLGQIRFPARRRLAKFAGCDGLDQDGDGISDNCEEDLSPPELLVPPAFEEWRLESLEHVHSAWHVPDMTFKSNSEAVSYLKRTLQLEDDCAPLSDLKLNITAMDAGEPQQCMHTFQATPIHYCDGAPSAFGAERHFHLKVDSTTPTLSCGFKYGRKVLVMQAESNAGSQLVNTGFFYNISELCSDSVRLDVSVRSDEYDGDALMVKGLVFEHNGIELPEIWVSPTTCHAKSHARSGGFCRTGDASLGKTRIYDISVAATDQAGWSTSETCTVIVIANESTSSLDIQQDDLAPWLRLGVTEEDFRGMLTVRKTTIERFSFHWRKVQPEAQNSYR